MTPLEYGRSLQSKTTTFLHVGDAIPVLHNLLFVYILFAQKTVETTVEAKVLFEKILAFTTPGNKLPRHIHEFPTPAHDSHYADILFVLSKLKRYVTIPALSSCEDLPDVKKALIEGTSFTPQEEWEWKYALLLDPEMPCSDWDRRYLPSLDGTQWNRHEKIPTFLDYVMQARLGKDISFNSGDFLFTALLPRIKGAVASSTDIHLIQSKDDTKQLIDMPECSLFCLARKGFFTKLGHYQSTEDAHPVHFDLSEITCYFPVSSGYAILVNGQKQTTFYLGDTLQLHTPRGVLLLSFTQGEGTGQWMGHIGRGDRPGQTQVSSKQEFVHFDYTITLRSMKRSDQSSMHINWDYVEKAGESTLTPIACNPLSTYSV